MTTLNHSAQGFLISYLIWNNPVFIAIAVYLSIRADVEKFFYGEGKDDWNGKYYELHQLSWENLIIPFHNLHILEDFLVHKKTGGMNKWYIPLEILTWIIIVGMFL